MRIKYTYTGHRGNVEESSDTVNGFLMGCLVDETPWRRETHNKNDLEKLQDQLNGSIKLTANLIEFLLRSNIGLTIQNLQSILPDSNGKEIIGIE